MNAVTRQAHRHAGFSMVEILLAAMILAIGFIMLLPAFAVGLNQSRKSVESAMVLQLGQNAEAYCRVLLDLANDPNFSDIDDASDDNIRVYQFGLGGTAIPNDASIRVYGDPAQSRYYWSMLYRFPNAPQRSLIELWIFVCKREEANDEDLLIGVNDPQAISAGGSGKQVTGNVVDYLEGDCGAVTSSGEILRVGYIDGSTAELTEPIQRSFSSVYIVKPGADGNTASEGNDAIGVFHTYVGY